MSDPEARPTLSEMVAGAPERESTPRRVDTPEDLMRIRIEMIHTPGERDGLGTFCDRDGESWPCETIAALS